MGDVRICRSELTEQFEVALAADELVEADVRLYGDTRAGVTDIGIVAGDDGEALALGLPREVRDGVCI